MMSRYFFSFNLAALLTFSLFFALQMLIAGGDIVLEEKVARPKVVFGDMPKPKLATEEIEQPVRPTDVQPPETIEFPMPQNSNGPVIIPTDGLDPKVNDTPDLEVVNVFASEGEFVALIRPAPQYPVRMSEQGIEGFVRVRYTVNALGGTENIEVVESSHSGFERSAIKAAERFKFKPRVENGEPQVVHNVYSTLEFKLEG